MPKKRASDCAKIMARISFVGKYLQSPPTTDLSSFATPCLVVATFFYRDLIDINDLWPRLFIAHKKDLVVFLFFLS